MCNILTSSAFVYFNKLQTFQRPTPYQTTKTLVTTLHTYLFISGSWWLENSSPHPRLTERRNLEVVWSAGDNRVLNEAWLALRSRTPVWSVERTARADDQQILPPCQSTRRRDWRAPRGVSRLWCQKLTKTIYARPWIRVSLIIIILIRKFRISLAA